MDTERLNKLLSDLSEVDAKLAEFARVKSALQSQISDEIADDVRLQLADKDYGCGTATIDTENNQIKVTIAKRVKWDNAKLSSIFDEIQAAGENPKEYIRVEYSVGENNYKAFPSKIKEIFEPARTVEIAKPTLTINKKA
jgi:hypothetical protein